MHIQENDQFSDLHESFINANNMILRNFRCLSTCLFYIMLSFRSTANRDVSLNYARKFKMAIENMITKC